MPLDCSILRQQSSLTATKNTLLGALSTTDGKSSQQSFKRKSALTETTNRFMVAPSVKNKFLKTDDDEDMLLDCMGFGLFDREAVAAFSPPSSNDEFEPYEGNDFCYRGAKFKKKSCMPCRSIDVEEEVINRDVGELSPQAGFAKAFYSQGSGHTTSHLFGMQRRSSLIAPLRFGSSPFSMPSASSFGFMMPQVSEISRELNEMPAYCFPSLQKKQSVLTYKPLENDSQLLLKYHQKEMKKKKMRFLNAVSTSLLYSPRFKNADDPVRCHLMKCAEDVISFDPEFVLKIALYARQELNIRSTANFLLALSAHETRCRPFLKKYFESSICLPTDWMDVAEMYLVFNSNEKPRFLPAALRKVLASSFSKFDNYQLAKYNRKKKKSKEKIKGDQRSSSSDTEEKKNVDKTFTLKELIRLLHITSPKEQVMSILGKKYPDDPESFRVENLPGTWSSEKAGKRMKLPVAETWETMISAHGNKAHVWESLIDNFKLPYMASLRNLKNLLLADISRNHHERVQARLSKKEAVIKSRQFPLRFYSAFKMLEDMEKLYNKEMKSCAAPTIYKIPVWKRMRDKALQEKIREIDVSALERYKEAVSKALEISANHNIDPIAGKTLVICDLTDTDNEAEGEAASFVDKTFHYCILLSLMCLKACEDCEVKVVLANGKIESLQLKSNLFLENMSELCRKYEDIEPDSELNMVEDEILALLRRLPEHYLKPQTLLNQKLDNVILLKGSGLDDDENFVSDFLFKYRNVANPNLLFIEVDLQLPSFEQLPVSSDENNVYIAGFSEHIFKFIAERSNGGQLTYVENIDQKYDLTQKHVGSPSESVDKSYYALGAKIPIYSGLPKWKTARIFISSTFKDMHGERDLLMRYVFPELKARASSIFVKINEVDLRWGISETDSLSDRSHQLCLLEAQNSDFFIGILGERYGSRCTFSGDLEPSLKWVKSFEGSSITELEIQAGALNQESSKEKAFFYFRNNALINNVPEKWKQYFEPEDPDAQARLTALKDKIRQSGREVFDGYSCHFAGVYEENPIVAGLDSFGNRVLNNLWNGISKFYKEAETSDELSEEETYHQMLSSSLNLSFNERDLQCSEVVKQLLSKAGIHVVTGKPGSGKTSFIIKILQQMKGCCVVPYFLGRSSQAADLSYMLCQIGNSILSKLPVNLSVPDTKEALLNNFCDIITEGSKASYPGNLFVVIDGLDCLDIEAQALDWLPYDLPLGFTLVCTTTESSHAYSCLLKREISCPVFFTAVKPLLVSDRQLFVRHYLKQHGKFLDESPFNNQMLQLVTKPDSGNPLYLRVACDYLKTFAVFENLMQKLRAFPPMLNQVLQEIICQMEKSHGSHAVQNALSLMCIAKDGLEEKDMHILLSMAKPEEFSKSSPVIADLVKEITSLKPENLMSFIDFCSLLHMLKTFAYPFGNISHGTLRLASKEFSSVIVKHYAGNDYMKRLSYFHKILAAYYITTCDPESNQSWDGNSAAFGSLLYHLCNGKCYIELANFLCSFNFIQGAFQMNVGEELPGYYETLLHGEIRKLVPVEKERIEDYRDFVNHNMHILKSWPFLIHQQALNEPTDSCVYEERISQRKCELRCATQSSLLNCRFKTLDGFAKNITCVKTQDFDNSIAALGSEDGSAKILNVGTGKVVASLRGHSSGITAICFVGKDRICLSSADKTLSIWSWAENYRIGVLEGHTRNVSSCCCDPQGNIVSSGWDCTVRFWSSVDGRQISCISEIKSPVNSVAHHPQLQQIACGLWNKTVQVWDVMKLKKLHTLHGHTGSVRSVMYNSDGLHLLSSSLHAEIFIWSTSESLKVAKLVGHASSVNSISGSSNRSCFVTASDDTTLKVWPHEQQAVTMTIQKFKTHPVHFMEIVSQLHLAVAFQNSTLRVFDLVDGHVVGELDARKDPASCFSKFNSSKEQQKNQHIDRSVEVLVFGTKSGKAMELKLADNSVKEVDSLNSQVTVMLHTDCVIFCGTTNGDIGLLSFSNKGSCKILYASHENSITALSVSMCGMFGTLFSTSGETAKLWDFKLSDKDLSITLKNSYPSKHNGYVTSCCVYQTSSSQFSKVKDVMVTGSYDSTAAIWDDTNHVVLHGLKTSVIGIYYSGRYITACGSEGSIIVWTPNGKCVSKIPGIKKSSAVIAFDFPKEQANIEDFDATLALVESDGSISIRKPFQRSSLFTLLGHSQSVTSCDINLNNEVISCSLDKTVNIWKIPKDITVDAKTYHSGKVNAVALSHSGSLALSGDEYGTLIMWQVDDKQDETPMKYITQKKYPEGRVSAVLWMKDNTAVCAAQIQDKTDEKHFIETLDCGFPQTDNGSSSIIQVKYRRTFSSEILAMDYQQASNILVVGLKSGSIYLSNSKEEKEITLGSAWVLKCKLSPAERPVLHIANSEGVVKCFTVSTLMEKNWVRPEKTVTLGKNNKLWVTALNCSTLGEIYIGSSSGQLTLRNSVTSITKQAHMDAVNDICVVTGLVLTCSADKTVKVWSPTNLTQVGQFHSQNPLSCLTLSGGTWNANSVLRNPSLSLIFGTTVSDVHLLKLESQVGNSSFSFGGLSSSSVATNLPMKIITTV